MEENFEKKITSYYGTDGSVTQFHSTPILANGFYLNILAFQKMICERYNGIITFDSKLPSHSKQFSIADLAFPLNNNISLYEATALATAMFLDANGIPSLVSLKNKQNLVKLYLLSSAICTIQKKDKKTGEHTGYLSTKSLRLIQAKMNGKSELSDKDKTAFTNTIEDVVSGKTDVIVWDFSSNTPKLKKKRISLEQYDVLPVPTLEVYLYYLMGLLEQGIFTISVANPNGVKELTTTLNQQFINGKVNRFYDGCFDKNCPLSNLLLLDVKTGAVVAVNVKDILGFTLVKTFSR